MQTVSIADLGRPSKEFIVTNATVATQIPGYPSTFNRPSRANLFGWSMSIFVYTPNTTIRNRTSGKSLEHLCDHAIQMSTQIRLRGIL